MPYKQTKKIIDLFQEIGEEFDKDSVYIITNYSGRGMYGETCLAIVCNDALITLQDFCQLLCERLESDEISDLFLQLGNPRSDSMGHGQVLYWPKLGD